MVLQPSLSGQTVVDVPPLGTLQIDSHKGPLRLDVTVQRIKQDDVRAISHDPGQLRGLPDQVTRDLRHAVIVVTIRGLLAAVGGSLLSACWCSAAPAVPSSPAAYRWPSWPRAE